MVITLQATLKKTNIFQGTKIGKFKKHIKENLNSCTAVQAAMLEPKKQSQ